MAYKPGGANPWLTYNRAAEQGELPQPPQNLQGQINYPNWWPAMREFSSRPTEGQPYWTPRRIARYYNALKTVPYAGNVPTWIDVPKIETAYQYLKDTRSSDWQTWEDDLNTDPVLTDFVRDWSPPPLEVIPKWEQDDFAAVDSAVKATTEGPVGVWTNYGIDYETWQKMPWTKKALLAMFRSEPGQISQQAINLGIVGASLGSVLGPGGTAVGGGIGAGVGAGLGAIAIKEQEKAAQMEAAGLVYEPSLTYKLLMLFDEAYRQSQSLVGFVTQGAASAALPETYGSLEDFWNNRKAAWDAGRAVYMAIPSSFTGSNLASLIANADPSLQTGFAPELLRQLGITKPGATIQLDLTQVDNTVTYTPGGENPMLYALKEARGLLASGQLSPNQVVEWYAQRFGFAGEFVDLVGGYVLDPLDLIGPVTTGVIGKAADIYGNAPLKQAFGSDSGNNGVLPSLREYRQILRQMPVDEVRQMGNITQWFAGLDKQGVDVTLRQKNVGFVDKMFGLTKESRADALIRNFNDGLANMLNMENGNVDGMYRIVDSFARMTPGESVSAVDGGKIKLTVGGKLTEVDMPRWSQSAEAQIIPPALKDQMPKVKDHYDLYNSTRPQAEVIKRFADALGETHYDLIANLHGTGKHPTDFDTVMRRITALAAEGDKAATDFLNNWKSKDMNNAQMKQIADLFSGKDGVAYDGQLWGVQLMHLLDQGAEDWMVKWFGIKPAGWAMRFAGIIKQAQGHLLLGNNPLYLANNAINNVVTMAWEGVLGGMTKKTRTEFLRRYGYPSKLRQGIGGAEIGDLEAGIVPGTETGTPDYKLGQRLRTATKAKDGMQKTSDLLHMGDKFQVAAVLSKRLERFSSEVAMVKGLREYIDRAWVPGVGYDKISGDLRLMLDAIQPGTADRVETLISRGLNKTEIEAEIFTRFDKPALKDVLTPDEINMMDAFPGMMDEIDRGLREATTDEARRTVFHDVIAKAEKQVADDLHRKVTAIVHQSALKAQTEGLSGVFDSLDTLVPERHDFWQQHMQHMDDVASQAEALVGLERANLWRKELELADQQWQTFSNAEGAKWLGMFEGLGAERMGAEYGLVMRNLSDVHDVWNSFYQTRRTLMDDYWGYIDGTDFTGLSKAEGQALRSAKWTEINEKLNVEYLESVMFEDATQVDLDAMLVKRYADQMGATSGQVAAQWRDSQLKIRRTMMQAQSAWRTGRVAERMLKEWGALLPKGTLEKIALLNNGEPIYRMAVSERDKANKKFYGEIYRPLIGSMMDTEKMTTTKTKKGKTSEGTGKAETAVEPKPAQEEPKAVTPAKEEVTQSPVWKILSEKKPEFAGVDETGRVNPDAKLNVIKWLRKWSPEARTRNVKRWPDVTPALVLEAWRAEEYFKAHQPAIDTVAAVDETPAIETAPVEEAAPVTEVVTETPVTEEPAPIGLPVKEKTELEIQQGKWASDLEHLHPLSPVRAYYMDAVLPTKAAKDNVLIAINELLGELPEASERWVDAEGNWNGGRGVGGTWYWNEYDTIDARLKQLKADRALRASELKKSPADYKKPILKKFDEEIRATKNELSRLHSDYQKSLEWLRDSINLGRLYDISRSERVNDVRSDVMSMVLDRAIYPAETYIPPGTPMAEIANLRLLYDMRRIDELVDILNESGVYGGDNAWDASDFERRGLDADATDYLTDQWIVKYGSKEFSDALAQDAKFTEGMTPEAAAEFERAQQAEAAREHVIAKAQDMRANADEMLMLAPPKEVNEEIFREYLHEVFADAYPDKPEVASVRAEATWIIIDRISETKAKEAGMTKDEWYAQFILQRGGDEVTVGDALARTLPAETWYYSQLTRTIEQKMPNKASNQQIRGLLKGLVKEDEMKWTGLDDFLNEHKTATKQEVLDFLNENRVEVKEVLAGTQKVWTQDEVDRLERQAQITGYWGEHERAVLEFEDQQLGSNANATGNETKYASYVLPGGKDYRELLLTLPSKTIDADTTTVRGWNARARAIQRGEIIRYHTPHWSEPNVLAHVRFDERIDADGKRVLFIEEIQSDWHQAGREKGYIGDFDIYEMLDDNGWFVATNKDKAVLEKIAKDNNIQNPVIRVNNDHGSSLVPPGPFSKSWEELTMKRMIRWAAENGYDRVAWTTGKMQADRYNLAKQVRQIGYQNNPDGTYTVSAQTNDGRGVLLGDALTAEQLSDAVGKDLATKIVNGEGKVENWAGNNEPRNEFKVFSGEIDLAVGGEGMHAFYDKKIPNIVRKYIKKWGGEVGETNISQGREYLPRTLATKDGPPPYKELSATVPSFDVTDAMRESAMQGQPLFRTNEEWLASVDRLEYTRGEDWIDYRIFDKDGKVLREDTIDVTRQAPTVLGEAVTQRIIDGGKAGILTGADLEGLNPGGGVVRRAGGATWWLENGKAVIHAFRRAGVADMLHEYVHAITPLLPDSDLRIIERWYAQEYGRELKPDWNAKGAPDKDVYEKLARGFERYMTEGPTGFTGAIAGVFAKIKTWMLDIYKSLNHEDIDIRMNDELRGMFDRWLGAEPKAETAPVEPAAPAPSMWDKGKRGENVLYRIPTDSEGGPLNEPPAVNSPLGTADELNGLPYDDITFEGWNSQLRPLLEQAQQRVLNQPRNAVDLKGSLDKQGDALLRSYLGKVYTQLADTKMAANKYAESRRDAALLDYSKKTGIENMAFSAIPYGFWYTHTAINWALRALNKPSILANYYRLKRMQERHESKDGYPQRLKGKIAIPMPWLPEGMGDSIYIDPMRQLFPVLQLTRPFERAADEKNQTARRTDQLIYDMVDNGEITDEQAQQAIEEKAGAIYIKAKAEAESEQDRDFQNPFDYAFTLSSPLLPLTWAYKAMTGRADEIGQLPFTRLVQNATAMAGIGGARGVNLEGWIRKGVGLPEVDQYEDFRVNRELSNMVAEGLIDPDTAATAMVDRTGEAFTEAQRRVSQQGVVKYIGGALALDLFPEGEMKLRGLQDEFAAAYDAKARGDKSAVNDFFDKYPEYSSRLMVFKEPDEQLRFHLRGIIWDKYLTLPKVQAKAFRESAGDVFEEAFLNSETRSYDSISTDTLAMWANSLGETPEKAGTAELPVDWMDDETVKQIESYYNEKTKLFGEYDPNGALDPNYSLWQNQYLAQHPNLIKYVIGETNALYGLPEEIQVYVYKYRAERDTRYPGIFDIQDGYFQLPSNQRKSFLKSHPELPEYWDWRKQMAAAYPKASPYILSDESLAAEILDEDYVSYNTSSQSGYSGGSYSTATYNDGRPATGYHPPYLTSTELKRFSAPLIMQLMARFYRNEKLMPGAYRELTSIWEQMGKPFGNLEDFIEYAVKPTITQ